MHAVYVTHPNPDDPVSAVRHGQRPSPEAPKGWEIVTVAAASINRHDLFALAGIGPGVDYLPMILGSDAAGVDSAGRRVLVYPVIRNGDSESLLSERHQGTFAEFLTVPTENLVAIPDGMSMVQAACLPTAWLTAYRMLFSRAQVTAGDTVLVQGAGGGLSTALIMLGEALGARVWVTGTTEQSRCHAIDIGADRVFEVGARLPENVDYVMDSVGAATWGHSIDSLRPSGTMVIPGATSGFQVQVDLLWIFAKQLSILGSSLGSLQDLRDLVTFCVDKSIEPPVHQEYEFGDAREAFAAMHGGAAVGKLVLRSDR